MLSMALNESGISKLSISSCTRQPTLGLKVKWENPWGFEGMAIVSHDVSDPLHRTPSFAFC